ncbi:MAG: M20/M25/M40 family metallo-hydrolase [Caulobacteraceae bacterium]
MRRLIGLFACLAAALLIFYLDSVTPRPLSASAPPAVFSAGRAMADIAVMARAAHPIGSPANHRVRDYLVGRMTALGLSPRVQRDQSFAIQPAGSGTWVSGGDVENVIGVLPGTDRAAPALALMAHYDSVPGSPGAADDITSVASALEMARAMKTRGPPARDVLLVITDGEEPGLLGARAFFKDNPLAAHIGFVINMETRGGGGRATMFETSADNGQVIALFRRAAVRPEANSLAFFLYRRLPNQTDFTIARRRGLAGLNFAFIGRQFDYHSPSSTVAALDRGSVQHMGEEILPVATALAYSPRLPGRAPDVVYGNLPFGALVLYPAWIGWLVLALAAILIAIGASRARRQTAWSWIDVGRGVGAGLLLLSVGALLLELARAVTGVGHGWLEYRPLLARFATYEFAIFLVALAAALLIEGMLAGGRTRLVGIASSLVAAVVCSALGGPLPLALGLGLMSALLCLFVLGEPASLEASWTGLLLGGLIAAIAVQARAPTIGLTIAWPLTAAAACAALTAAGGRRGRFVWVICLLLVVLSLAWLGSLLHGLLQGLDEAPEAALVIWLGAMVLWPLGWPASAPRRGGLVVGAAVLAAGLALAVFLHVTSPWSARHPRALEPIYVVDPAAGRAWRASPRALARGAWIRSVLTADGGAIAQRTFPGLGIWYDAAPARPVPASPPAFTLTRDGAAGLSFQAPMAGAERLDLDMRTDTAVSGQTLDGRPAAILSKPGRWTHIRWQAAPEGVTVGFRPAGPGVLEVRWAEHLDRWPAQAEPLPPMSADGLAWDLAGSTVVVGAKTWRW